VSSSRKPQSSQAKTGVDRESAIDFGQTATSDVFKPTYWCENDMENCRLHVKFVRIRLSWSARMVNRLLPLIGLQPVIRVHKTKKHSCVGIKPALTLRGEQHVGVGTNHVFCLYNSSLLPFTTSLPLINNIIILECPVLSSCGKEMRWTFFMRSSWIP
jgi:hypothetical protein